MNYPIGTVAIQPSVDLYHDRIMTLRIINIYLIFTVIVLDDLFCPINIKAIKEIIYHILAETGVHALLKLAKRSERQFFTEQIMCVSILFLYGNFRKRKLRFYVRLMLFVTV